MKLHQFVFNPFMENTYILWDETGECAIIDPGCTSDEEEELVEFIEVNNLNPTLLLNTHCHIDHIFGNRFVKNKWDLPLYANSLEVMNIQGSDIIAGQFGVEAPGSPMPDKDLQEGQVLKFGNISLEVIFSPGHSAGHVVFFNRRQNILIGGDVLFRESIGRTDLPGGNYSTLINSIRTKIFPLGEEVVVYPGHGPETTIGYEKKYNPFLINEIA